MISANEQQEVLDSRIGLVGKRGGFGRWPIRSRKVMRQSSKLLTAGDCAPSLPDAGLLPSAPNHDGPCQRHLQIAT
jgi:hypothetical protein